VVFVRAAVVVKLPVVLTVIVPVFALVAPPAVEDKPPARIRFAPLVKSPVAMAIVFPEATVRVPLVLVRPPSVMVRNCTEIT
jgi:hypothetical protein